VGGVTRAVPAVLVLATACPPVRGPAVPEAQVLRLGRDRTDVPYEDPRLADKLALLARINRDREAHGAPPVQYESRAALVGDVFCLEAALSGSWGHWDAEGRAPYLRWGLAGGVDFHAQNSASYSVSGGQVRRPVADLLLQAHESMMAETPPDDGHRRTILDPQFTHVGIGAAVVGGEFRMTEEFTRSVFEWVEVPDRPLRAGQEARFAGRPPAGLEVAMVEVRFEAPPRPLSLADMKARGSYRYPPVWRTLDRVSPGTFLVTGGRRDFQVSRDRVVVTFPLTAGPGHYFVLCYVRPAGNRSAAMTPATGALVTALP
jgi:uncharacterized protein YkwD